MYSVRPIMMHFALWGLLAPLFLLELRALSQLNATIALQDRSRVRTVLAAVTEDRHGSRGPEIRYEFQVAGWGEQFRAMNTAGWGEAWIPISEEAWREVGRQRQIMVVYLPESPAANQPIGRVGYPIGDSAFAWALFLLADLAWLFETAGIIRNYLRCQTLAERREERRLRFWRTVRLPTATERYQRLVP